MAFWDELQAPVNWRAPLQQHAGLRVCGSGLLLSFVVAVLLALSLGESAPLRPSALMRQGYDLAWILNSGFLIWGASLLGVALRLKAAGHIITKLGLLLMGGGFFALALWSAAPLEGELPGSPIEARLHAMYFGILLVGFALASGSCASRASGETLEGLVSGGALGAVYLLVLLALAFPSLITFAEVCGLLLMCGWCLWWARTSSE